MRYSWHVSWIWGSGSFPRFKILRMRAADESGDGYWPNLACIKAAREAQGNGSSTEDEEGGRISEGRALWVREVNQQGLVVWRDPASGWRRVMAEDRMRVGVSERRVKTAPRYKVTVRRFLD